MSEDEAQSDVVDLMSSPDPLIEDTPSPQQVPPPSSRRVPRSEITQRFLDMNLSPRKRTFELDVGDELSPQRILVTVEAEDGVQDRSTVSRRLFQSPGLSSSSRAAKRHKGAKGAVTTTTVPLRGLSDDEGDAPELATPRRGRGRPRKSGSPVRPPTPARDLVSRRRSASQDILASDITLESINNLTPRASNKMRRAKRKTMTPAKEPPSTRKKRGRPRKSEATVVDDFMLIAEMEKTANDVRVTKNNYGSRARKDAPPVVPARSNNRSIDFGAQSQDGVAAADMDDDIWLGLGEPTPRPNRRVEGDHGTATATLYRSAPEPARPEPPPPATATQDEDMRSEWSDHDGYADDYGGGGADSHSDIGSEMSEGNALADAEDTVMRGEEFTMITLGSLPSMQQSMMASSMMAAPSTKAAQEPPQEELGDETSLIIHSTLEALRQSQNQRMKGQEPIPEQPTEERREEEQRVARAEDHSQVDQRQQESESHRQQEQEEPQGGWKPQQPVSASSLFYQPPKSPRKWNRSPQRTRQAPLRDQVALNNMRRGNAPEELPESRPEPNQCETADYDDSFSEIPPDILERATPARTKKPRANRQEVQPYAPEEPGHQEEAQAENASAEAETGSPMDIDIQPSIERPSTVNHSNPQSEANRLLTPDETPSPIPPDDEGEGDPGTGRSRTKSASRPAHGAPPGPVPAVPEIELPSSPPIGGGSQSPSFLKAQRKEQQQSEQPSDLLQPTMRTRHSRSHSTGTPLDRLSSFIPPEAAAVGAAANRNSAPALPALNIPPPDTYPPRPTLSPVIRIGQNLQAIMSDPPSPPGRESLLRSPFRGVSMSKSPAPQQQPTQQQQRQQSSSRSPSPPRAAPPPAAARESVETTMQQKAPERSWMSPFKQIKDLVASGAAKALSPLRGTGPAMEDPFGPDDGPAEETREEELPAAAVPKSRIWPTRVGGQRPAVSMDLDTNSRQHFGPESRSPSLEEEREQEMGRRPEVSRLPRENAPMHYHEEEEVDRDHGSGAMNWQRAESSPSPEIEVPVDRMSLGAEQGYLSDRSSVHVARGSSPGHGFAMNTNFAPTSDALESEDLELMRDAQEAYRESLGAAANTSSGSWRGQAEQHQHQHQQAQAHHEEEVGPEEEEEEDIWAVEAKRPALSYPPKRLSLSTQPTKEPVAVAEPPLRSKLPSPWRNKGKTLTYSDEIRQREQEDRQKENRVPENTKTSALLRRLQAGAQAEEGEEFSLLSPQQQQQQQVHAARLAEQEPELTGANANARFGAYRKPAPEFDFSSPAMLPEVQALAGARGAKTVAPSPLGPGRSAGLLGDRGTRAAAGPTNRWGRQNKPAVATSGNSLFPELPRGDDGQRTEPAATRSAGGDVSYPELPSARTEQEEQGAAVTGSNVLTGRQATVEESSEAELSPNVKHQPEIQRESSVESEPSPSPEPRPRPYYQNQREFQPRNDLYSPVRQAPRTSVGYGRDRNEIIPQSDDATSPGTPGRSKALPHVPQKMDFTPRSRRQSPGKGEFDLFAPSPSKAAATSATAAGAAETSTRKPLSRRLFGSEDNSYISRFFARDPPQASAPVPAPPNQLVREQEEEEEPEVHQEYEDEDSYDQRERDQEDSPDLSIHNISWERPTPKPLPPRDASPSKSCIRSPLKGKIRGRVVEIVSPLTQEQRDLEERRGRVGIVDERSGSTSSAGDGSSSAAGSSPVSLSPEQQRRAKIDAMLNRDDDIVEVDEGEEEEEEEEELDWELAGQEHSRRLSLFGDSQQTQQQQQQPPPPRQQQQEYHYISSRSSSMSPSPSPSPRRPAGRDTSTASAAAAEADTSSEAIFKRILGSSSQPSQPPQQQPQRPQWTRDHWLRLDALLQARRKASGSLQFQLQFPGLPSPKSSRHNKSSSSTTTTRKPHRLLGKEVTSQGETLILEQWHLDVVDAFMAAEYGANDGREVWSEDAVAKRLFALMVGEVRRAEGRVDRDARRRQQGRPEAVRY